MKISMSGRYSPDEFAEAIDRVIQNFTSNGADEFRAVTLYFNAYREKRHLQLRDEESGTTVQHLEYDGPFARPYRSISPRIQIVDQPNDQKQRS